MDTNGMTTEKKKTPTRKDQEARERIQKSPWQDTKQSHPRWYRATTIETEVGATGVNMIGE